MVTLRLTVLRARILSRQLHARIREGKAEWLRYSTIALGLFNQYERKSPTSIGLLPVFKLKRIKLAVNTPNWMGAAMVKRLMIIWGVIAAVSLAVTKSADAQNAASTIYRLNQQSTYQEGCIPPCTCPVSQPVQVIGTFILTPAPGTVMATYQVSEVNWTFIMGNQQFLVTGSGTYKIGGGQQRLQLALSIGGQAPLLFDSGLVPANSPFPNIAMAISNISGCLKKVFAVNASPVPVADIHPYDLLSGSTFQRGCFPPCQCALGPKQPLTGDFVLVNLQPNPLFQEFAVVNIDWTAAPPPGSIPINGGGFYKVGGEVAVQQEMSLELSVDGGSLTHFDSGLVQTDVRFPLIDVTVSIHGERCADTVIVLKAEPS